MVYPAVYEGTGQELTPYLAQHPNQKFRLIALPEEGEELPLEQPSPVLDAKRQAALALLGAWIEEGMAASEETRHEAQQELEEFKRNMNANRVATGERPVYP